MTTEIIHLSRVLLGQRARILELEQSLRTIIVMNRQHAADQFGDAEKAESWACVRVARAALEETP